MTSHTSEMGGGHLPAVNAFWFRRDLRFEDNSGLSSALSGDLPVIPVFIFDREILDPLPENDRRVTFIHQQLENMNAVLANHQSSLLTFYGMVITSWENLVSRYSIQKVFCNHDYEPYARERDDQVKKWLASRNIELISCKDQVIYEKDEVLKDDGQPYTVFTPYMKKWKSLLNSELGKLNAKTTEMDNFFTMESQPIPDLISMGFKASSGGVPEPALPSKSMLVYYQATRDYPAKDGTSRLSIHLRFGTISIRKLVAMAMEYSDTWLNELIWREFYMMILWQFPYVTTRCFKPAYDLIPWTNDEEKFERWCQGNTGYPLVDAGMRELNHSGYMHNRLRMVTASFLTKHLLINWQWGEAYFAEKLLDFELSSNNGGWQWAAGCGCDAAPYFRIFNPWLQAKKFDPDSRYIKKWVTNIDEPGYPEPMIDHKFARDRAINTYQQTLAKQ